MCCFKIYIYSNTKLFKADTGLHFHSFRGSDSQLLAVMWLSTWNNNIPRDCKRHAKSDKRNKELKKSGLEVLKWNLFTSGTVTFNSNSHKMKYYFCYKSCLHRYIKKTISQVSQGVQFYWPKRKKKVSRVSVRLFEKVLQLLEESITSKSQGKK